MHFNFVRFYLIKKISRVNKTASLNYLDHINAIFKVVKCIA